MKRVILSTEVLDRIWNDWLGQQMLTGAERRRYLERPFCGGRSNKQEQFENWLLSHGASIRRINKRFHIEFTDPSRASFFILRYS